MTEWNKELERSILKKSRFTLSYRIIRLFIIGLVLYAAYTIGLNAVAGAMNITKENDFYSKLALDWKVPNVRGGYEISEEDMSLLGTKRFSYSLLKTVGRENLVIGEANAAKSIIHSASGISYSLPGREQLSEFSFSLPEHPATGKKLTGTNPEPDVWQALDMLPEGTVAELAFSTTEFTTPEELVQLLERFDIDVLWMPLLTGEFEKFEPGSWGGDSESITIGNGIGLAGGRSVSKDYSSSTQINSLNADTIKDSKNMMLENMEELLNEKSDTYLEQFLGLSHLEERYEFLKENGFIAYGAVVTGPTKELLKLQNDNRIRGEQLGETELWNWTQ